MWHRRLARLAGSSGVGGPGRRHPLRRASEGDPRESAHQPEGAHCVEGRRPRICIHIAPIHTNIQLLMKPITHEYIHTYVPPVACHNSAE